MMAAAANPKVLSKNTRKFVPEKVEQVAPGAHLRARRAADCNGKV
jgi:hypothetical protein